MNHATANYLIYIILQKPTSPIWPLDQSTTLEMLWLTALQNSYCQFIEPLQENSPYQRFQADNPRHLEIMILPFRDFRVMRLFLRSCRIFTFASIRMMETAVCCDLMKAFECRSQYISGYHYWLFISQCIDVY